MGMGGSTSMASDKSDQGSSVKVVGLLAMGATLMLIGLSLLPPPYSIGFNVRNYWTATATAGTFGGLVLIIVGLISLWRSHLFWGSAFVAFGAFFSIWTSVAPNVPVPSFCTGSACAVGYYGLAGFAFVFVLIALTFLISSMKHGWMSFILFLFVFITLILWLVQFWMTAAGSTVSNGQMWATGGFTILAGLVGWYIATATLTNWTYGKKFLPG